MNIYSPTISGSLTISGSIITTGGGLPLTGSLISSGSFTSIGPTVVSGSFTVVTGSTIEFQVLDAGVKIGNLVTDSHSITGSLTISGSITTNSTITAQTLVVQTITSSVSFITGSTRFGSLSSNTHQFTGSVLISGSNVLIGTTTSNGFRFKVSNNGAEEWALNPGDSTNINNHVNYNRNTSAYIGANYLAATHSFLQGNVGIGTSSPAYTLDVSGNVAATRFWVASGGNATDPMIRVKDDTDTGIFFPEANTMAFSTAAKEGMRITSGGFFKASNFANPTYGLYYHQIFNNIYGDWIIELAQYNAVPYGLLIRYPSASPRANTNEMIYLNDSTGNVFKVSSNGNVYNLNNSYNALSDIKLKENITDATPKLDKLMQVRVVNFNLKTDPNIKQIGVIAQELQEVFPGLVEENYDRDSDNKLNGETTLGVKYSVFVPMLIKAIQELKSQNDALQTRIETLEQK